MRPLRRRAGEGHPLLGQRLRSVKLRDIVFESQLSPDWPAYLTDHRVFQRAVFPAAAYLEMALAAGASHFNSETLVIEEFVIQQAQTVQLILEQQGEEMASFEIYRLTDEEN